MAVDKMTIFIEQSDKDCFIVLLLIEVKIVLVVTIFYTKNHPISSLLS